MPFKYHLLFVGVNKGIGENPELDAAERDAVELARAFRDLGLGGGERDGADPVGVVETLVGQDATIQNVRRALRVGQENECDLLLVFWAGHFDRKTRVLVTTDIDSEDDEHPPVHLTDLATAISSGRAVNRVLLLDVCYGGEVLYELLGAQLRSGWESTKSHRRGETLLAIVSADANSKIYENGRLGPLATLLLPELKTLRPGADGWTELGVLLTRVQGRLPGPPPAFWWGDLTIRIPVSRSVLPLPVGGREPLEQAMGYAVQAFRDYLNANVVKNVEVIYFLAYDVWDGCLVYDGLVHDSVEHRLLEYIRTQFLDRDRLRSRFEERTVGTAQNGAPARVREADSDDGLGAAGQCFQQALEYVRGKSNANPVRKLWYLGDLRNYPSEYRAYDRLLGLGSCLYIPVVGNLVPASGREFDAQERPPLGGILMAASREPYGLVPNTVRAAELHATAKVAAESYRATRAGVIPGEGWTWNSEMNDRDIAIGAKIVEELLGPEGMEEDGKVEVRSTIEIEIENFLQCIGKVYAQRAKQRSRLRRIMHPQSVKGVVRALEQGRKRIPLPEQIEEIADRLERNRANGAIPADPVAWARSLARNNVGEFTPDGTGDSARGLTWTYVMATAWRDLRLEARKKLENAGVDARRTARARAELLETVPEPGEAGKDWEAYIRGKAEQPDDVDTDNPNYVMQAGDSTDFHLRQVRRLIDDLRDLRDDPFTFLRQQLCALAPVDGYLEGIAEVEAVLASSERQEYLRHLAHTAQIWLLGVWVLEACRSDGKREMDHAATHVENYFRTLASCREPPPTVSDWFSKDRLALYWGLLAAMHDLAEPVQRFAQWSQRFLERYFGGWSIQVDLRTPVLLDVLHHTRYPFYKNAITSLYSERERNWLESVFYAELVMWLGHPVSGSLILVHEMEKRALDPGRPPEVGQTTTRRQPQMWRRISELLQPVLMRRGQPEQGLLLPAYLAHAIAFSHLESIKAHWFHQYSQSNEDPKYLADVADQFQVVFEQFPLTYLMGLCEVLLEQTGPKSVESWEEPPQQQEWLAWRRQPRPRAEGARQPETPPVEVTYDDSDPYTGLSPFFVKDVQIKDTPSPTRDAVVESAIVITIALWLDGLERETNTSFSLGEIDQLRGKFLRGTPKTWHVLNVEDYRQARGKAMAKAAAENRALPLSDDTSYQEEDGTLYVSRPAFEILRMIRKLTEFKRHYRSTRAVRVFFSNVENGQYVVNLAASPTMPVAGRP